MHELAIAQQVVKVVLDEAGRRHAKRVKTVEIEVGQLEGLGARELREAFSVEAAGTPLEGAFLQVATAPAMAFCLRCREPREAPIPTGHFHALPALACKVCGGDLRLEGGRGFSVRGAVMDL